MRVTKITPTSSESTTAAFEVSHDADDDRMPRPTAAAAVTVRLRIRPITPAASVESNSDGPPAASASKPRNDSTGTRTIDANADRAPAATIASIAKERTGIPTKTARSGLSGTARIASPRSVRPRPSATTPRTTGTIATANSSLPPKMNGSSVSRASIGTRNGVRSVGVDNHLGSNSATPVRI